MWYNRNNWQSIWSLKRTDAFVVQDTFIKYNKYIQ